MQRNSRLFVADRAGIAGFGLPRIMRHHAWIAADRPEIWMTTAATPLPTTVAAPSQALLPLALGGAIYAVLLLCGDQLLRDPDTYWQITVGNWIIDNHAVPHSDIYSWTMRGAPWISTQWLAQVGFAASSRLLGWNGPVLLAAASVAIAFGLLTRFVRRWLAPIPTLVLASVAFALCAAHVLARPHALAMPVMVAFVGGLMAAMDRRSAPSLWLLPLMALWANLHGGFVFGLALIAPIGLGAIWAAPPTAQPGLVWRWGLFGLLAIAAACITPYGWDSILAAWRIIDLGEALALIGEWRAADFGHPGPLEMAVLGGFVLALWRGFALSPVRAMLIAGMIFMALSHVRNAEVLALLAPLVLARPLAEQTGGITLQRSQMQPLAVAGLALMLVAGTAAILSAHRFVPSPNAAPVAAVAALKERGITRVLNDYDFGGYLIASGVAPYIDGRTELYGEAMMVAHNSFSGAQKPDDFFRLVSDTRVQATLLRTQSAATTLLDHLDGWKRIYGDDLAVVHVRDAAARHTLEPPLRPALD